MDSSLARAIARGAESNAMPFTQHVETVPGRVLHIDGDYAAYYCSGKDGTPIGLARRNVIDRIEKAVRASGAESVDVHLTSGDSHKGYRYLIAESRPYQGQRNAGRKPDNWHALRDFMENYEGSLFNPVTWSDREADDGMAYMSTVQLIAGKSPVIHTRDKDMRMFGGLHLEWQTFVSHNVPLGCFESYDRDGLMYGHKWFWSQLLTGDSADHIPGLPRVGKEAALRILRDVRNNEQAFGVVTELYRSKIGDRWADYFVEQAALLWMRACPLANVVDYLRIMPDNEDVSSASARMKQRVLGAIHTIEAYSCG
jgi:DNA polymerase-1